MPNGFQYASELISAVRKNFLDVAIYVAGYPEKLSELEFTNKKVQLGINACITQICFDSDKLYDFSRELQIPVLPGVIFPTEKSVNFSRKLGINVPKIDDPSIFLKNQISELIKYGFNHIHFYTLNHLDNLLYLFYENI